MSQEHGKEMNGGEGRPWRVRFYRLVRTMAAVYLLVCLLMVLLETYLVYPAPPRSAGGRLEKPGVEDVEFQSADGTMLHGRFFPHPNPQVALLYCHGNGEDVAANEEYMMELREQLRASVFIFDYRGYGWSEGTPHEEGIIADGISAQRWLAGRLGVGPEEITIFGRSLGGGVAVAMAEQQNAKALVLYSTFPDMTEVAAMHYPWLPVRWLMRNRYPSVLRLAEYDGPVIQFHGTADRVVPFELGRQLIEAAPGSTKQFIEIPDGRHNDLVPEFCEQAMVEFLNELPALDLGR